MKRPKVIVASLPTRFDAKQNRHVSSFDLSSADEFGDLLPLQRGPSRMGLQPAIDDIIELAEIVEPGDYVLAIGDVVLTAALLVAACDKNGSVQILRWQKSSERYKVQRVTL